MSQFIRDTSFGRFARLITRNRVLRFPEEQDDFQLQDSYVKLLEAAELRSKDEPLSITSQSERNNDTYSNRPSDFALPDDEGPAKVDEKTQQDDMKTQQDDMFEPKMLEDGTIVVNWYGPDDPANPQNWTTGQKLVPTLIIDAYTFAVYLGSSIITGSYTGIMRQFDVSQQVVSLTLSMYVLAYGIGPLLWSPLSEIPSLGRNSLYIFTFAIFIVLLIPTALVNNFPGLVVLRFLLGFFGSPCLATGPATFGDIRRHVCLRQAPIRTVDLGCRCYKRSCSWSLAFWLQRAGH
jgi:DHA1 family multidrug resistance protein-like MFS transporter